MNNEINYRFTLFYCIEPCGLYMIIAVAVRYAIVCIKAS